MKTIAFIMYTHSSYSDIWPLFFGQTDKYVNDVDMDKYIFVDKIVPGIPDDYTPILYSKNKYVEDVISCLEQVPNEYCIFQHEDMFLYKQSDTAELETLFRNMMVDDLDSIRFIKAAQTHDTPTSNPKLHLMKDSSPWIFSIQPSLWKTESLYRVYRRTGGTSIWDFETKAQNTVRDLKMRIAYTYDNEPKRGRQHYDSNVWPYIATAVLKGKWTTSEYPELVELLKEYKIDPSIRGGI